MKVHNPNNLPALPIADLLPTQGDLKDLNEKNYRKLKNLIERRGFSVPVYVWEDSNGLKHLLDGHQRQRVLTTEGWNEPIPYLKVPAKDMQEAAARLLEITSQYGTITQEGIDEYIAKYELPEAEVYEATNFDAISTYGTTNEETEVVEDEAPEVSNEPAVSKLGEVYQLGRHRLMCGSATEQGDLDKLLNGKKPDCIHTDPPYGLGKKMSGGTWATKSPHYADMHNWDLVAEQSFFDVAVGQDCDAIVWGGNYFNTPPSRGWLIWKKPYFPTMADCEIAYTNIDMNARVYDSNRSDPGKEHPTQKPLAVVAWALSYLKGETVLDLFGGSGSTLIACEQTDRTCYMMELDPKYVDVIRKRYAKFIQPDDQLPENWEELTPAINSVEKAL